MCVCVCETNMFRVINIFIRNTVRESVCVCGVCVVCVVCECVCGCVCVCECECECVSVW